MNANIEAIRKNVESEIQKQSRFLPLLRHRVATLQGATKQLASACTSLSPKGVNAVVERTVQATVQQAIVPRVDAVVEAMKEEVARLRQALAAGAEGVAAALTEGEVDAMLSEGLVKQLILRVSEEANQAIVMYACGKLFGPGTQLDDIEPGILMGLVYRVGEARRAET